LRTLFETPCAVPPIGCFRNRASLGRCSQQDTRRGTKEVLPPNRRQPNDLCRQPCRQSSPERGRAGRKMCNTSEVLSMSRARQQRQPDQERCLHEGSTRWSHSSTRIAMDTRPVDRAQWPNAQPTLSQGGRLANGVNKYTRPCASARNGDREASD
jgi:hypothetical protein